MRLSKFLRSVFSERMLVCVTTGFSSGLPLYVLFQLLPAWLRDSGVDLKTIGAFSLVSFPYTWKFLWSPLMDRLVPPLGRRRGWAALTQLLLMVALAGYSLCDPASDVMPILVLTGIVAFASASQDIVLDALRREILPDEELGFGNSMFVNAYRISSLVPGSLALILADQLPWSQVHLVVAAFMGVGLLTSLLMKEPVATVPPPRTLKESVVDPFRAFFATRGLKPALTVLAFMLLYKLGDSMATALATPFYLDMGFSKTEIGTVAKAAALWASIGGGIAGGLLMLRIGINKALWLFGGVQLVSIVGFAALSLAISPERLASAGQQVEAALVVWDTDLWWLFWVVSFEYLGVGLGTAAFVAFIARSTDKRYTATQLALLTSLTGIPRTFANAGTGWLVEGLGWPTFFAVCTLIALPGMAMLPWVAPWNEPDDASEPPRGV